MSRNGQFHLHGFMGTAYAPDAERSAEGDILGVSAYDLAGLREDDASVRMGVSAYDLRGLREDDAAMRLGVSAYDLRGLREDDASVRMGVSAYDLGVSAYDLKGLREDDASVRMGEVSNWDGATSSAEGSAEGHSVAQLGGILVSNGRVGGMREDDAGIRMGVSAYDLRGLREDDASVRMGTSYVEDASGSAEDPRGRAGMGVSAYDLGRSGAHRSRHLGPRYGTEYTGEYGSEYRGKYRGTGYMRGLREDDASVRMGDVDSMNAEAWAIEQKGKIAGLTENFRMGYILRGLREDTYEVRLRGLREDDASVRMGVSAYDLGRRRAYTYSVSGAEKYPPQMLAAEGFHERFPVSFQIRGLGLIRMGATWNEAFARIQTAISQEAALQARLDALAPAGKAAVMSQVNAMKHVDLFDGQLQVWMDEGSPGWDAHTGRVNFLTATEAAIPTVDRVITQLERGLNPNAANAAAINDINARLAASKGGIMDYALPIGAGVLGIGLLTTVVLVVGGK